MAALAAGVRRTDTTDEVLAEFGFSADEIGKLKQSKIV